MHIHASAWMDEGLEADLGILGRKQSKEPMSPIIPDVKLAGYETDLHNFKIKALQY